MEINPILALTFGWVLGILLGVQAFGFTAELPSLVAVEGYLILAAIASTFYFGKAAPIMMVGMGLLQSGLVREFPVAGLALGVATIGAGLYGKTLGWLALDDFYENGQTRLPGLTLAAVVNLLLILVFGLIIWFLFPLLPDAAVLSEWIPLPGLGV